MSNNNKEVFEQEVEILNKARKILSDKNQYSLEDLWKSYHVLFKSYEKMLGDATLMTTVSDRLQNRLNITSEQLKTRSEQIRLANTKLEQQNELLQNTIDELIKTKVSRRATTITLTVAVLLFLLSEGILEPWIEFQTDSFLVGFVLKGVIALLLRPIDYLVEKYLLYEAMQKSSTMPKKIPV